MKVAQVIPSLNKGGAEQVVIQLSNYLISRNHDVTLILCNKDNDFHNLSLLDAKVETLFITSQHHNRIIRYLYLPIWMYQNRAKLSEFEVFHLHLTFGYYFGVLLKFVKKLRLGLRPLLVSTCHNVGVEQTMLRHSFDVFTSRIFDGFVIVAMDSKWETLVKEGRVRNVFLIRNGIEPHAWHSTLVPAMTESICTVGTISRAHADRSPHLFIQLFSRLNIRHPDKFKFLYGGKGPLLTELKGLASELGISHKTVFLDLVIDPREVFAQTNIYVTLSVGEVVGISGLEAAFSGLPVFGIQIGNISSPTETCFVFSSSDIDTLANEISLYVSNPERLDNYRKRQNLHFLQNFTRDSMGSQYLSLYSQLGNSLKFRD